MQYYCIGYGATVANMSGDVKRRPYESARRREQAEETRRRVLEAASETFRERGWEGTSISSVAERAGVSEETVYARFGNKRALLGAAVERAVRGDDSRPVPEQDAPRAVAAAADMDERIRLFASDISARLERAAPLVAAVSAASRSEPELAELLDRLHSLRRANLAVFASGEALDTVWALTSPELYELLRRQRGWSHARYRKWLAETLGLVLRKR
jgi:AcrR family transcriptional regulator